MSKIRFGIIGGGWRAEFFLRIASQLPERFEVTGMALRDEDKGKAMQQRWGVSVYRTSGELIRHGKPAFVVVSVPRSVAPQLMQELSEEGIPVLCETPPASGLAELLALHDSLPDQARIQIAEQYLFQPNHAARLTMAHSGKLGTISQAQVSAAHDYHGISLLRHYLGIGFEDAEIRAQSFLSPITEGPGRDGPPAAHQVRDSQQTLATLRFGDKLAVYDFTGDQYFSWIRSPRLLVRGEKGEIKDDQVTYLAEFDTPITSRFQRLNAGEDGNLEGYYLKGIVCGDHYVYKNAYLPGRLTDDELAIATCLNRMQQYVDGGPSFYSLAEASQDHYLAMMIQQAVKSGETVRTSKQRWVPN